MTMRGINALSDPAQNAFAVVPSDVADLAQATRAIYIGGAGHLAVTMVGGETVTFLSLPQGVFPICVRRILATGTTATNMIALW